MILKRTELDGKVNATYESSNILASTLDTNNNDLTITFKGGGTYKYPNVSNADYLRFETAESQGNVFNSHIKKYDFEKLTAVDTKLLTEEIKQLKAEQEKAVINQKKNNVINAIKLLASLITEPVPTDLTQDDVDTIFNDSLMKLQSRMTDYFSVVAN